MPRKAYITTFFLLTGILYSISAHHVKAENRILSVGIPDSVIKYTKRDAKIIAAAFGRYVGFQRRNIKVIYKKEDTTKKSIVLWIQKWLSKDVSSGDMVILFISGHGILIDGEYYIRPSLSNKEDIDDLRMLVLSQFELSRLFSDIPTKNKLLILDTCFSGSIIPESFDLGELSDSSKCINPKDSVADKQQLEDKGSKSDKHIPESTIITACKRYTVAIESDKVKNGILTHYLVEILKKRAWRRRAFDSHEICVELSKEISRDGWKQKPISYGGEFFRKTLNAETVPPFVTY